MQELERRQAMLERLRTLAATLPPCSPRPSVDELCHIARNNPDELINMSRNQLLVNALQNIVRRIANDLLFIAGSESSEIGTNSLEKIRGEIASLSQSLGSRNRSVKILKAMHAIIKASIEGQGEPTDKELGLARCFIATAACGTPHAPDVIALQTFRDRALRRTRVGRVFIALYEKISPPIANIISSSLIMRTAVRYLFVHPLAMTTKKLF